MKYLKEYKGFDNKSPEGVELYCDDLLAELRDDGFKTSVEVSGKSTLTPVTNIGAVTINIISNTSITSTKGVTFISDITACFFFLLWICINYLD